MTDTKELTLEEQLQDQFKDGLDRDGAVALAIRVHELEEEIAKAKTDAANAVKAAKAGAATKAAKPPKPRKLAPIDEADRLSVEDLKAAIAEAETVEIAFSDGAREIAEAAPLSIEGDAWREHSNGLLLSAPAEIVGPAADGTSYRVDGYALLLDGKQVAYCKRSDPLTVVPGGKHSLAGDVIF